MTTEMHVLKEEKLAAWRGGVLLLVALLNTQNARKETSSPGLEKEMVKGKSLPDSDGHLPVH